MKSADVESAANADIQSGLPRILIGVERVLMKVGYAGLTMRAVAREAGVSLGTVAYFGSKESLVEQYAEQLFDWYQTATDEIEVAHSGDLQTAFYKTIRFIVADLRTERTAHLFPEFWAMGNHNPRVQAAIANLYAKERDGLERLMRLGWPNLDDGHVQLVVGTLIPMIEGHSLFVPAHRQPLYNDLVAEEAIELWLRKMLD